MVVSYPRKGLLRTEPREMVRVQLRANDIRSYSREDAEELIARTPGAFIVGARPTNEEAADDLKAKAGAKAQRSAPNKARTAKKSDAAPAGAPAETKESAPPEKPADPAETKAE